MKNMKKRTGRTLDSKVIERTLLPCMDYLHGDVAGNEFEAACHYEYARESEVLREAARLDQENRASRDENYFTVESKFDCGSWFIQHPRGFIWECPSFPVKTWNQLVVRERGDILPAFSVPSTAIRPLWMNDVRMLYGMGVLDELKAMATGRAAEREKNFPNLKQRPKAEPIVEGWPPSIPSLEKKLKRLQTIRAENQSRIDVGEIRSKLERRIKQQKTYSWIHALFTVDFSKGETRLKDEFLAWLKQPENQARLNRWRRPSVRTDVFKDRLKALAAWRLYDGCNRDWNKATEFANEHRKIFTSRHKVGGVDYKSGDPRPFHNPGREQGKKTPPNEVPLFRDQSAYLKTIRKAKLYRAELIPWEFEKFAR